jgi:uncharacterized protein YdhG (YjbR/CyaY superfamily)
MQKTTTGPATISEFIAGQPEEYRATLEALRAIILETAPGAEEVISYQVPCFKYHYMLVGIGVNKKFCSLYVMNPALAKEYKDEFKKGRVSGSTIHFEPGERLPAALIKKIVKSRMKENEQRAMLKK